MGLSLWLMLKEPFRSKMQAIISDVANAETSPSFQPHMTIISIPQADSVPELNTTLAPILQKYENLRLQFDSLFIGPSYFISVALSLQKTSVLLAFQQEIVDALQAAIGTEIPQKEFFPHISLYYGDTGAEERHRIASFVRTKGVHSSDENGTTVEGATECLPEEIWMVRTEGKVKEWEVLGIFKLEK